MTPYREKKDFPVEDYTATCYSCGAQGMAIFYEVQGVPPLVSSQETPFELPTADIRLGFCRSCGFIENVPFDTRLIDHTFEETQSFSPTFSTFARDLAQRLIDQYDLRDKDVIEIGCGRGEFLVLLCELGDNRGVGIDPASVQGRVSSEVAERITFIQDFYSDKHHHIAADFICCRHTLEHIQPTGDFLRSVRRSLGERWDAVVFFEVPDVSRILREGAFWDIHYEHCSYFSLGSLARLFRSCGFEVLNLTKDFNGQYLLIDARPDDGSVGPSLQKEKDLEELARDVSYFALNSAGKIEQWKRHVRGFKEEGRRAVIWGGGAKGVSFLTTLGIHEEIEFAVDINPFKHGRYMPGTGQKIVPPEFLKKYRPDVVIVMNPIYSEEIQGNLYDLGVSAELVPV